MYPLASVPQGRILNEERCEKYYENTVFEIIKSLQDDGFVIIVFLKPTKEPKSSFHFFSSKTT